MGFLKFLALAAIGVALVIPVGAALLAVGLPILAVGGALLGVFAVVAFVVALPLLIVGAVILGLFGALFGILGALLGFTFFAAKIALAIVAVALILQFIGRRLFGKDQSPQRPSLAEPVKDRYDIEAEKELDEYVK